MVDVRKNLEKLYTDTCSIYGSGFVTDEETGITKPSDDICVIQDEKCRISFKTLSKGEQTEVTNNVSQEIKLFISPDIEIKEGSKIVVKRNRKTFYYKSSGIPAIYKSHQEVLLLSMKEYA